MSFEKRTPSGPIYKKTLTLYIGYSIKLKSEFSRIIRTGGGNNFLFPLIQPNRERQISLSSLSHIPNNTISPLFVSTLSLFSHAFSFFSL